MIYEFMTDVVWERMKPLFPDPGNFGRPRCSDRDVLEGILWVLKTGARRRDIPKHLPSSATCWRRLKDWDEEGVWDNLWRVFIFQLDEQGLLEWQECFMDGSTAPAQKRGLCVGKTKKDKGAKWMLVADGQGLPVGGTLASASPAEVTLSVDALTDCRERTGRFPKRLIADRAYDADRLRNLMRHLDGELICPHRRGRKRKSLQDGRALRRCRKRWKVERLFAWLGTWRRLLVRHERLIGVTAAS